MHLTDAKENEYHMLDIPFVLLLFCVFAISAVILILFGADIYQKTVSAMNDNYASRTAAAYLTEKIRQSDIYNAIRIDDSLGYERLLMTRSIGGTEYATALYEYDGYLYEFFARTNIELSADAGQPIIALTSLQFEFISDHLLKICFYDETDQAIELYVNLHCTQPSNNAPILRN